MSFFLFKKFKNVWAQCVPNFSQFVTYVSIQPEFQQAFIYS